MDKIFIKDLTLKGILGIHQHEQETPQRIRVNVTISTDISAAAKTDDIRETVNYSTLAKQIRHFILTNHFLTIEALIEALANEILSNGAIEDVWLKIEKPDAVPDTDSVGVVITRSRST